MIIKERRPSHTGGNLN